MPDRFARLGVPTAAIRVVHLHCDYPSYGLREGDRITLDADGRVALFRAMELADLPPDLAFALGQTITPQAGLPAPPSPRPVLSLLPPRDP